jgi:hypothetical protein
MFALTGGKTPEFAGENSHRVIDEPLKGLNVGRFPTGGL